VEPLLACEIEALMADFGATLRALANHPDLRWLGPHKGVIHLALSSIANACWDLWAKSRGVPLWRLILDLSPEDLVATLDLSYLEDALTADDAIALLRAEAPAREARMPILEAGYPGYDTSFGWFGYSDAQIRDNAARAVADGFDALKLKVGHRDPGRDITRARLVRETVGPDVRLMVDANQQWTVPQALAIGRELADLDLFWIEEPTHPDDIVGHRTLARELAPTRLAIGEHVANRIAFKNYLQLEAAGVIQVDAVRVAGVSEFLAVSLLARQAGLPVVPHVGDMGQIHQHLVLANHIALGLEPLFLEYIPHLRGHFAHPAVVEGGRYRTPQEPGSSSDLLDD
ncbi:MAG TPA: enolase C-terminal domain-like protein, partial [Thermomicrobiales bacterium]|nr:enolase C-terminal domain-like protein [Thermomicrobiales bacterium]